jgi:hypothetical protein
MADTDSYLCSGARNLMLNFLYMHSRMYARRRINNYNLGSATALAFSGRITGEMGAYGIRVLSKLALAFRQRHWQNPA